MVLFLFFLLYLDENATVEKRIVLHSQTDLLDVITNLSNQVKELSNNVSALTSNQLKQEAETTALKNDIQKLQSGGIAADLLT